MRLSTQSLQQRLNQQNSHQQAQRLPFVLSLLVALLSGAMFSLSLAPYGIWIIAIISPAILYAQIRSSTNSKQAFVISQVYGTSYWCVGAFWLYTSIHTYGDVPVVWALLAIFAMGLGMGLFHGILAWLFHRFMGRQPFAFAALWVIQEWLKTWLFTGFPWLFVGYAFTEQYWLSSIAPVFGVLAVSFVAVLLAASLVEVAYRRAGYLLITSVIMTAPLALWLINPQWTKPKDTALLTVSLIQGNIPQDLKWLREYQLKTLEIYAKLTRDEWKQDVVVWPESSIPMFQTEAWGFISEMAKIAKENNTTWITGIPYKDDAAYDPAIHPYPPFYNSVIVLGSQAGIGTDTEAGQLYKKQRLVPFGEYIPFQGMLNLFPNLAGMQNLMSYSRGSAKQAPLGVRGRNMGVAICYEVAYPDTTRKNAIGSDFLLTISNDAWFGTSAGPLQHLQMVQMRSLETGRWFVRATNTGVTAIIDDKGRIIKQAPQFERTVLRGEVQAYTGQTPFVRFGHYPILVLTFLLSLLSYLAGRANRQTKTIKKSRF